jgi:uncharacterized membrane protein YgdD (TMEM256/DUF423 family)
MNFSQSKVLRWSANLFIAGLLLFSGSLYILSISGIKTLGMITPFGGACWIAAWILLLLHYRKPAQTT